MKLELNFVKTKDAKPEYGRPCLIVVGQLIMPISYSLERTEGLPDWFEPFGFTDFDSDDEIPFGQVEAWCYLTERIEDRKCKSQI